MKENSITLVEAFRFAGLLLSATLMVLMCASVAIAQPTDDQYGSPVDSVSSATDALGVLPDTGGPLLLIAGGVLVAVGVALAIQRQVRGRR